MLLRERFPVPLYVECDQYGSQARFLLAKLNPSATHATSDAGLGGMGSGAHSGFDAGFGGQGAEIIFTDDISMNVFMQHLAKLAVQS